MSSTLEQIHEFTTLGEARAFAVEMMDSGHLVDVRQQAVYKTLGRLTGLISFLDATRSFQIANGATNSRH